MQKNWQIFTKTFQNSFFHILIGKKYIIYIKHTHFIVQPVLFAQVYVCRRRRPHKIKIDNDGGGPKMFQ